jgi:formylglycine-generating enzyme required for sulfatase activity
MLSLNKWIEGKEITMPPISSRCIVPVVIIAIILLAHVATAPLVAAQTPHPVEHNADWTPVFQTFDGVEMALVPDGCFDMGSNDGEADEQPVHQQCFNQPFWIDRTEVTNLQYGSSGEFSGAYRPRESVNWFEARDFCLSRGARLPTEREWEYAASGPDDLIYPWGNKFVPQIVVYRRNSDDHTANVGSQPQGTSWVGALDLSGNVSEWVSTIYQPYPYNLDDGREVNGDITDVRRVLRGGAWNYDGSVVRAANRAGGSPIDRDHSLGFRCARDYE